MKTETTLLWGIYRDNLLWGIFRDNGKENGNCYITIRVIYRDNGKENGD